MPIVTGPELDSVVDEARQWYVTTRQFLIEKLTEGGYPYGTVPLTPSEQYQRFLGMKPEDWQSMEVALMNQYRGLPDQRQRVQQAMQSYLTRMQKLGQELQAPAGGSYGNP